MGLSMSFISTYAQVDHTKKKQEKEKKKKNEAYLVPKSYVFIQLEEYLDLKMV